MKYCTKCWLVAGENEKYCPHCGKLLTYAYTKNNDAFLPPGQMNYHDVLQRYLKSSHFYSPKGYASQPYFQAEFVCILSNIQRHKIQLSKETVKRKNLDGLNYHEWNIRKNTNIAKLKDFVSIDTETTGLHAGRDRIIEVAAILWKDFQPISIFQTYCNPNKPIPPEASKINGITDAMVQNAPPFSSIIPDLKEFIGDYPLVVHNAEFDLKFLYASGADVFGECNVYDTLEISRNVFPGLESYRLTSVCEEVKILFPDAHSAASDALAAGLLFLEMVKVRKDTKDVLSLIESPYREEARESVSPSSEAEQPVQMEQEAAFSKPQLEHTQSTPKQPDFIAPNLPDPDDWQWDKSKKRHKKSHHSSGRKVGAGCGCLVVIVVVAAVITALCMLFSNGKSKNDAAVKPQSGSQAEQPADSGVISPELFRGILEESFQEQDVFSDVSVQYDSDLNYYTINLTAEGISMDMAKSKLTGDVQEWKKMRSGIEDTSNALYEKSKEYGINASICINVMNDMSSDKVLLSVMNGATLYDCMEE